MNKKVKRTFDAMAVTLCNLDDKTIKLLHKTIADGKDGYPEYDLIATVNSFRVLLGTGKVGVK